MPGAISNIGPVQGLESEKKGELYQKSSSTTNYEISKKVISQKDNNYTNIKRITAAVTFDSSVLKDIQNKIDKYALKSYEAIHGDCPNLGDISKIDQTDIPSRGDRITIYTPKIEKITPAKTITPINIFTFSAIP